MARKKYKPPEDGLNMLLFEPETTWSPPTAFPPEPFEAQEIGLDLETKDPTIRTHGPGTRRGDGYPVGISLATDNSSWYFPFNHQGGGNLDQRRVVKYFKELLNTGMDVVGANILYDAEWLDWLGISIKGKMRDIQIAECLLDEESESFSLDSLALKYFGERKDEKLLREAAEAYGVDPKFDLWKLPSKYVGMYAEVDASLPLRIYQIQKRKLKDQRLWNIFDTLETELIPILLKMRKHGVKVDVEEAQRKSREWQEDIDILQRELDDKYKMHVNVNSGPVLAKVCQVEGWDYPRTLKGNPSFDKQYFKYARSKTMKKVAKIRNLRKLRGDFVDKLILDFSVGDRIYANFNQMGRTDDGEEGRVGTRTGRFSSNRPNLQQVPARDPELAPIIRGFFIPDKGKLWAKLDYSQQEPRILVHYAYLMRFPGSKEARYAYIENKDLDYYQFVANKSGLERKPAKDLTLGIFYGEGKRKIALDLGMSMDEAKDLRDAFEDKNPYVRDMYLSVMKVAADRGYVRTVLGRHRHFSFWEPVDAYAMQEDGKDTSPVFYDIATQKWPGHDLRRAFTYKALNALIQGSAADMTKAAMLKVYRELGLVPHLQVHDELNYSVKNEEQALKIQHIMENAIPEITVPMKVDLDLGERWK